MKLPNNYGGITKLKGNRRKPYWVRKTIGYDDNGKQQFYTIGYYITKSEAIDSLSGFNKKDITDILGLKRLEITLEKLYDEWYKRQVVLLQSGDISGSSLEGYRTAWKHLNIIGDMKVRELKKVEIQSVIDRLYKDGYSKSALGKVRMLSGQLMEYAMEDDILDKNYAKLVKIPTVKVKEKDSLTTTEIAKIEKSAKTNEWAEVVLILIYTGMRIGELLALTKFNVDIENMIITGGAKTDAGKNRPIPIHSKIKHYFLKRYETPGEYFVNVNGKSLKNKVDNFRKNFFKPLLIDLKIRTEITPHYCRHTFGTLMDKAGLDTVSMQRLIGHSDYSTTANIYTHPDIEKLRTAIEKI